MGCESSKVDEQTISKRNKQNESSRLKKEEQQQNSDHNQVDGYFREEVVKKEKMLTLPREDRYFKEDGHNLDQNKEKKQFNKPKKAAF